MATPPYSEYNTPKIIAKNGITLGSISKRSFQLKLFLFKASILPLFHVEKIDHNIKRKTSKRPGIAPAKNKRPIDVSVEIPYTIIVTEGGINMPKVPPAAIDPDATSSE